MSVDLGVNPSPVRVVYRPVLRGRLFEVVQMFQDVELPYWKAITLHKFLSEVDALLEEMSKEPE